MITIKNKIPVNLHCHFERNKHRDTIQKKLRTVPTNTEVQCIFAQFITLREK